MVEKQSSPTVGPCPRQNWADALALVFGHLDTNQRAALVAGVSAGVKQQPDGLGGLLVAMRNDSLVGAIWAQLQPGATAVLWPPGLASGEAEATSAALMREAVKYLRNQQVRIAQAMLERQSHPSAAILQGAEFAHFVDLLYLMAGDGAFPVRAPAGQLSFVPYGPALHQRLASVVEQTYLDTQDCPRLNEVRKIDDVLAGYRATGAFAPERWLLVEREGQDVGCLILADHPGADQWELVYMGVLPEFRGVRLGLEIVRYAQWLTAQSGRPRLVLAVDASNRPAIEMYTAAGFQSWDRRSVFLRVFEEGK